MVAALLGGCERKHTSSETPKNPLLTRPTLWNDLRSSDFSNLDASRTLCQVQMEHFADTLVVSFDTFCHEWDSIESTLFFIILKVHPAENWQLRISITKFHLLTLAAVITLHKMVCIRTLPQIIYSQYIYWYKTNIRSTCYHRVHFSSQLCFQRPELSFPLFMMQKGNHCQLI